MEALTLESRHKAERELIELLAAAPQLAQHRGSWYKTLDKKPLVTDFDQAYCCASAQFVASGNKNIVGDQRGTPIVSTWPAKMFEKAKAKFGTWWTKVARDGDSYIKDGTIVEPMILQAFYQVLPNGDVLQLCWARPDYYLIDERLIISEKDGRVAL